VIALVQTTFPDRDEAERIGRAAVEARLAACCNVLGASRSVYRWRGEVETADEVVAQFKTSTLRARRLVEWLTAHHSYELAAIESWEATASPAVEEWIALETS
jgi:periplasmic divalent cation tolerance protein